MTASAERQPFPSGELLTACCSEWKDVKLLICLKDQNRCVSYSSGRDPALGINLSFFSFSFACFMEIHALRPNTPVPPKTRLSASSKPHWSQHFKGVHTYASLRQMATASTQACPSGSQGHSSDFSPHQNHQEGLLNPDFRAPL